METSQLHIPAGINYECSGCGKCCTGWTVPMTPADYQRVSSWDWTKLSDKYKGKKLYRQLKTYEKAGTPYTHAMVPAADGFCPFLVDNLCFIHGQYGASAKPSMCQLFPYCFNETPSGIYSTVSFVSFSVVYNTGKALTEQRKLLDQKLALFRNLYPNHQPNWSKLQLAVGQGMTWSDYLEHENHLIGYLEDKSLSIEKRLLKGSQYLFSQLSGNGMRPVSSNSSHLKKLDLHLLVALHKIYYPAKPLGKGECDFNIFRFLYQLLYQQARFAFPTGSFSLADLQTISWPVNDHEIDDLLYRYFYSRIFGKLYFGAGFGQLSLVTGFHHLLILYALIKLQSKAWAKARDASQVSFADVVASVRELEKRLGESKLGGYEAAVWELLMQSRMRIERILAAA